MQKKEISESLNPDKAVNKITQDLIDHQNWQKQKLENLIKEKEIQEIGRSSTAMHKKS